MIRKISPTGRHQPKTGLGPGWKGSIPDYYYIIISDSLYIHFTDKNFDYPEKPLKYKHIRRISD